MTAAHGFRYARPSTLEEAILLMEQPGAMVLAGGQTLIPRVTAGMATPELLVDLGGLDRLKLIEIAGEELTIGAMVTLTAILQSATLARHCPLLPYAAEKTATAAVRNRATLVGNLVWADAASQLPVVALAVDATLQVAGRGGSRLVAARDFFLAPNLTVLHGNEMISHLRVKAFPARTGCSVSDIAMRQNSRALATAAAVVTLNAEGRIEHASLAVGGCGDVPRKCPVVEARLTGALVDEAPGAAAAALLANPPQKGAGVLDAEYAIAVLPVLLRKAVRDACSAASKRKPVPSTRIQPS